MKKVFYRGVTLLFLIVLNQNCQPKTTKEVSDQNTTYLNLDKDSTTAEKKNQVPQLSQIIFGTYCSECARNCATMFRYTINGRQSTFSADFTDGYFKKSGLTFNTTFHEAFYFDIAKEIVANIPDTLLNNHFSTQRFGCPDCTDGCGIYFEMTKDNKKQRFYIDYQTSALEGDMKIFADFLKTKVRQLKKM